MHLLSQPVPDALPVEPALVGQAILCAKIVAEKSHSCALKKFSRGTSETEIQNASAFLPWRKDFLPVEKL
jgi:hypothetical protein